MTAESYPDITARVQHALGDVVPPVAAGRGMATDFGSPAAPVSSPRIWPGCVAATRNHRVLPGHVQITDRLLPRPPIRHTENSPSITRRHAITGFLDWLQTSRHNSASTRNQRLAAISFVPPLDADAGTHPVARCQDILAIPASGSRKPAGHHLTVEQTRRLLANGPVHPARPP